MRWMDGWMIDDSKMKKGRKNNTLLFLFELFSNHMIDSVPGAGGEWGVFFDAPHPIMITAFNSPLSPIGPT